MNNGRMVELIDRDKTLEVLEGITEGAACTESAVRNEGAQLVRALVLAALKSKSLVPTVAVGNVENQGNVTTVTMEYTENVERVYSFEECEEGETAVEMVPLDKAAEFLARNYEPPVWYRNVTDMLDVKKRLEMERERMDHLEEVWKEVLRAAAMEGGRE